MRKRLREVLSVYNLFFISAFRKLSAAVGALLVVQAAVLACAMRGQTLHLESVAMGYTLLPTIAGLIILTLLMCDILRAKKSNVDFTIRRLRVKPMTVFFVETVYAMIVLLVYWALSAGLVYAAAVYFTENISQAVNRDMDVLLAFYRSNPLHKILPIGDAAGWLANFALIFGLGTAIAGAGYNARKGKNASGFTVFMINALIMNTVFNQDNMGMIEVNILFGLLYLMSGIFQISWIRGEERDPSGEPAAESKKGGEKNGLFGKE